MRSSQLSAILLLLVTATSAIPMPRPQQYGSNTSTDTKVYGNTDSPTYGSGSGSGSTYTDNSKKDRDNESTPNSEEGKYGSGSGSGSRSGKYGDDNGSNKPASSAAAAPTGSSGSGSGKYGDDEKDAGKGDRPVSSAAPAPTGSSGSGSGSGKYGDDNNKDTGKEDKPASSSAAAAAPTNKYGEDNNNSGKDHGDKGDKDGNNKPASTAAPAPTSAPNYGDHGKGGSPNSVSVSAGSSAPAASSAASSKPSKVPVYGGGEGTEESGEGKQNSASVSVPAVSSTPVSSAASTEPTKIPVYGGGEEGGEGKQNSASVSSPAPASSSVVSSVPAATSSVVSSVTPAPTPVCKDGEKIVDGKCVSDSVPVCKDGETIKDGKCIPSDSGKQSSASVPAASSTADAGEPEETPKGGDENGEDTPVYGKPGASSSVAVSSAASSSVISSAPVSSAPVSSSAVSSPAVSSPAPTATPGASSSLAGIPNASSSPAEAPAAPSTTIIPTAVTTSIVYICPTGLKTIQTIITPPAATIIPSGASVTAAPTPTIAWTTTVYVCTVCNEEKSKVVTLTLPPGCAPTGDEVGPKVTACVGGKLVGGSCIPDSVPTQTPGCKEGEKMESGKCVAVPVCKSGEKMVEGKCVADTVVCKGGETMKDGACVPTPAPTCNDGEKLENGKCVPDCKKKDDDGNCIPAGSVPTPTSGTSTPTSAPAPTSAPVQSSADGLPTSSASVAIPTTTVDLIQTRITTEYVYECPTGLKTVTTIITAIPKPTPGAPIPDYNTHLLPGWTTTVRDCKRCAGNTKITQTLPPNIQPTGPLSGPITSSTYPHVPIASSEPEADSTTTVNKVHTISYTLIASPTFPGSSAPVTSTGLGVAPVPTNTNTPVAPGYGGIVHLTSTIIATPAASSASAKPVKSYTTVLEYATIGASTIGTTSTKLVITYPATETVAPVVRYSTIVTSCPGCGAGGKGEEVTVSVPVMTHYLEVTPTRFVSAAKETTKVVGVTTASYAAITPGASGAVVYQSAPAQSGKGTVEQYQGAATQGKGVKMAAILGAMGAVLAVVV